MNILSGLLKLWYKCDVWCNMAGCSSSGEDYLFHDMYTPFKLNVIRALFCHPVLIIKNINCIALF